MVGDDLFQRFEVVPVLRRDRDDLRVRQLLLQPAQVRHQLGFVFNAVGLVQRDDQRAGDVLHTLEDHLVFVGPLGAVNDKITTSTSFNAAEAVLFM